MQAYLQHLAVPKICFIENTMLSIKVNQNKNNYNLYYRR